MVAGDAVFPAAATKTPKSMNQYFFAKVSFLRQQNDGTIKKESEQYLVDAMSFTETEARVIREVGESVRDLYFDSIAHSPIQEVVSYGDTDLWFKCKVVYKDVDPDSGKEKKTTLYILVNANDVNEAYDRCKDHLKEMLVPFEIPKVEETAICEIYQYEKPVPAGYLKRSESPIFVNQAQKEIDALGAEWNHVNGASNLAEDFDPAEWYEGITEDSKQLLVNAFNHGRAEAWLANCDTSLTPSKIKDIVDWIEEGAE